MLKSLKKYIFPIICCVLQATAEANNLSAVADAKEVYISEMEGICGGTKPYMNTETIESEHRRVRDKAIQAFNVKKKMGGEEFSQTYKEQLEKVFFVNNILISVIQLINSFKLFIIQCDYKLFQIRFKLQPSK